MLRSGYTIGQYTLKEKIGNGAFGVVWLAEKKSSITTTEVAIKISFSEEIDLDGIKQEANIWVRASGHPNVIPIIEADILDDQLIIVSEYAKDGTLDAWLDRFPNRRPPLEICINVISGILDGLEHLHKRSIIHRDLKPANILFQGNIPRLADFGISRALDSTTQSRSSAGTPYYMAPEAFDGVRNERTDIWSMGVIIFQIFNNCIPFQGSDIGSIIKAIFFEEPTEANVFVPLAIKNIIERALQKNPAERYQSIEEMKKDLNSKSMKFQLLIEPPQASDKPVSRRFLLPPDKLEMVRETPRGQHYQFAHVKLRDRTLLHPYGFLLHLNQPRESRVRGLSALWFTSNVPGEPYLEPTGLDCISNDVDDSYHFFVVKFPRPERMTEAFFSAIVIPKDIAPEANGENPDNRCRYLTLELGISETQRTLNTVMCEWRRGAHFNYGIGPDPMVDEFIQRVRALMLAEKNGRPIIDELKLTTFDNGYTKELGELAKATDFTEIITKLEFSLRGNVLTLDTPEAVEVVRTLISFVEDVTREDQPFFAGVFLQPAYVMKLTEVAEGCAEAVEEAGYDSIPVKRFIDGLVMAAKQNGAVKITLNRRVTVTGSFKKE